MFMRIVWTTGMYPGSGKPWSAAPAGRRSIRTGFVYPHPTPWRPLNGSKGCNPVSLEIRPAWHGLQQPMDGVASLYFQINPEQTP